MEFLPSPAMVSLVQIIFASICVLGIQRAGYDVDELSAEKMKSFMWYVLIFVLTIYANMQALQHSNVETVIVFRACSPIATSVVEYMFMGREWPTKRSTASMCACAAGAILYCLSDSQLALNGIKAYYWVFTYFWLITLEMTYGKTLAVKMDTVWGPVLYQNLLSIVPMGLIAMFAGDFSQSVTTLFSMSFYAYGVLLFSCVAGTAIGYTAWLCRGMISATSFTLVGVVNKFLTVLLNVVIWDKHSSPMGIFAVCICLCCGVFYQQAPRRADATIAQKAAKVPEMAKHIEMSFDMDASADEADPKASLLRGEDRAHPRR